MTDRQLTDKKKLKLSLNTYLLKLNLQLKIRYNENLLEKKQQKTHQN
jgi:hypothetical protein